jgi:hypothetical protein
MKVPCKHKIYLLKLINSFCCLNILAWFMKINGQMVFSDDSAVKTCEEDRDYICLFSYRNFKINTLALYPCIRFILK